MAWYHRVWNVVRPGRLSRELDREMAFHVAERTEDLVSAGMSAEAAAREAERRFGNRLVQKERTRDVDVVLWLESLVADVRYGLRGLLRSPGFAAVAVLSLALGIGANTAIFSLTNALLLRALPVSHPEELVRVTMGGPGDDEFTNPLWERIRDDVPALRDAFAFGTTGFRLTNGGVAQRARGAWVSGSFFGALGVRPAAGRLLQRSDDVRGCAGVAAVSAGFAERELGGVARAPGRTITLNGQPFEVVGVTEASFFGVEVGESVDVYAPLCALDIVNGPGSLDERGYWFLDILGRPGAGLTVAQVSAALGAAAHGVFSATLPADWPVEAQRNYLDNTLEARAAATGVSAMRARYERALYTLMFVVGLVLLIACANVANLMLARGAARERESAIRRSIGAGRARLVRQLLTESLLLSLMGAGLGVLFARWAGRTLLGLLSTRTGPVWLDLALDMRVLAFTAAVGVATGLVFGLAPAWRAARADPQASLRSEGRGVVAGSHHQRGGKALVVAQVALSLLLVTTAGLLVGSFRRLVSLDPGFRREGVLLVHADFQSAGLADGALLTARREMLRRLRTLPGVRSASASMLTPISGSSWQQDVTVPGYTPRGPHGASVWFNAVSDHYFATLGTLLLVGRDINAGDGAGSPSVAVINEAMARHYFGTASPLGRTFRLRGPNEGAAIRVVGVVADARYRSLEVPPPPTAYLSWEQDGRAQEPMFTYELRSSAPPATLAQALKRTVAETDPRISIDLTTLDAQVAASLSRPRLLAALSGFFAVLALLLAVIGLYGTLAYGIARRRNEIGVRMALGAARGRVVRMVLGEAGRLVAGGIAIGLVLAAAGTRFLGSLLFGVTPDDVVTFTLATAILAGTATLAALLPAWRAARMRPMDALRE